MKDYWTHLVTYIGNTIQGGATPVLFSLIYLQWFLTEGNPTSLLFDDTAR